jgi:4-diphosphocytidyl-2-C-methyl-D-erythritol kinase
LRSQRQSPCKVNLVLNVLARRADGFHELETLLHPVRLYDRLTFESAPTGIELTCSEPTLPTDSRNLVWRAAAMFLEAAGIRLGLRIDLQKEIPLSAGLGGGSGNAGTTLLGLNEMFGYPLSAERLNQIAASLGSDVPFFLQNNPALATGRGERIQALEPFACLSEAALVLVHPGFGVSTPWAYQALAKYPAALNGRPGRARQVVSLLQAADLRGAGAALYNSLEAPVLEKFPLLKLFLEFFREKGACAALMSGSGSATFALMEDRGAAQELAEEFKSKFGSANWVKVAAC